MNIEYAKSLPYEKLCLEYRKYLQDSERSKSTIDTYISDTFYLWNNCGRELFWDTVTAENFDEVAYARLLEALSKCSTGNVQKNVSGYLLNLKKFRSFVLNDKECGKSDEAAIKEFLLDIDCLNPLAEWTSQFNLFDILKITRTEIRHSNVLAWLLTPHENHGFGDSILRGFFQYYATSFSDDSDVINLLLTDFYDFSIQREWHSIDVLAVSYDEKKVLCIENKIDSGEHDNQLNRYRNHVKESFPDFIALFIYLSPNGSEPSDTDNWCSMSYLDVLDIIDKARCNTKLLPDAALLIDSYTDTIRRHIVGDERLAQICAEIYAKHQKALDLIFENRPDRALQLSEIFRKWARLMSDNGRLNLVPEKCVKSYTRFKTEALSRFLPDVDYALSGWNTHNFYFYEICSNDGKSFNMQLAFSSKNIPDELRAVCDRIHEVPKSKKSRKSNWLWYTAFSTKTVRIKDDEDIVEETIFDHLDKQFKELMAYESQIIDAISS